MKNRGVTLIEIIVVLIILCMLLAVILPFLRNTVQGKKSEVETTTITQEHIPFVRENYTVNVPVRFKEGKLVLIKTGLYMERYSDSSAVSSDWLLRHIKLTMQDAAKEFPHFLEKEFQERANDILRKNTHRTLDLHRIPHDKVFPWVEIRSTKVLDYTQTAQSTGDIQPEEEQPEYDEYGIRIKRKKRSK